MFTRLIMLCIITGMMHSFAKTKPKPDLALVVTGSSLFDKSRLEEVEQKIKKSGQKPNQSLDAKDLKRVVDSLEPALDGIEKKVLPSNYQKLEEIFKNASLPSGSIGDTVMEGRCVKRVNPEIFIDSILNIYVEKRGEETKIFMMPLLLANNVTYSKEDLAKWHTEKRTEVNAYTELTLGLPEHAPLRDLFYDKFKNSMMFSYYWRTHENREDNNAKREFYSVHSAKRDEGNRFLIIENICSSIEGCNASLKDKNQLFQFGEHTMFCYYHRGYKIQSPQNTKGKIKEHQKTSQ